MTDIDPGTADWLRSDAARAVVADAGVGAAWGELAVDTSIRCALDGEIDAVAEGARQMAFLSSPRVVEVLVVPGRRADLIGRSVTLTADAPGYRGAGAVVFVVGAAEIEEEDATRLRVVRRAA